MITARSAGRAAAAMTALLVMAGCTADPGPAAKPGSARPSATDQGGTRALAVGEVRTSANVKLLTNVPPAKPFDGEESWGTDLAFQGDHVFVGNYEGFTIYDIRDPAKPVTVSQVVCPGGQNDISVSGDLLFLSIDEPRSDESCASEEAPGQPDEGWEGVRIFDIKDRAKPRYVSSVATACGSHTHTTIPSDDGKTVYLYVSSPGPIPDSKSCAPPHETISIVEVPVAEPTSAKVVAEPMVFEKGHKRDEMVAGGCHDITAYPEKDLAAAACFGDGVLLDIADPVRPKVLQQVSDEKNFSLWHSATFSDDASKIVFTDELGGGGTATCDGATPVTKGGNAIYDLKDGKLTLRSYFKMPREQAKGENCVAHNASLIPVEGKDIMVQAWYQGGVSIWDFTDSGKPKEIGFFERGPLKEGDSFGGSWSAYYYNGHIYSSDITHGLDVIDIDDPLTDPAKRVRMEEFNVQTQRSYGK
ncbi:LVIVD repeat-containing protein [Spongiactinospora sp. 9N601]|uniref:LVIVD repeat-containing protein n=1 Tax=Spongiactinospora sp. 9N601 TaxID=3375149 RepID=UPI0037913C43